MNKIITVEEAEEKSMKLKSQKKVIVLAGGVFDILHSGHIKFLESAKKQGDALFVMVENDEKVKITKGANRPVNSQNDRIFILSALGCVDFVLPLPFLSQDKEYDELVGKIKPDIIATTKTDPYILHKKRQAEKVGGKVAEVIERIPDTSSTNIIKNI
jgi:rfaE bifunctional protein nucleotidyltransferase chain/domain